MIDTPARLAQCGHHWRGFTLLELLVAMGVLSLIIAILAPVFTNTMVVTNTSRNQLEATQQARSVLDSLREDLADLVVQNGGATVFIRPGDQNDLNEALVLVTRRGGPQGSTDQRFMAVAYTSDTNAAGLRTRMRRSYCMLPWNDADVVKHAFAAVSSTTSSILAEGVLRFSVVLNLEDGSVISPATSGTASWKDNAWSCPAIPGASGFTSLLLAGAVGDLSQPKVCGMTVAIASLDGKNLRLQGVQNMAAEFASPQNGKTPYEAWTNDVINSAKLKAYPRPAVSALRVLQLTYSLP